MHITPIVIARGQSPAPNVAQADVSQTHQRQNNYNCIPALDKSAIGLKQWDPPEGKVHSIHYSSYSGHSKFSEQRRKIVGTTALDCKSFTSYVTLQTNGISRPLSGHDRPAENPDPPHINHFP